MHYVAALRTRALSIQLPKQDVRHDSYASGYRQSAGHRYFPRRLRRRQREGSRPGRADSGRQHRRCSSTCRCR
ncbi:hypothetical protein EMIT0215P_70120 [Pseudomonas serboccidentalis]